MWLLSSFDQEPLNIHERRRIVCDAFEMSDDPKLPDAPGTPTPPPPPAPPTDPSGDLGSLAAEPTDVMPVTDPAAGGAVPPTDPPGAPEDPLGEPGEDPDAATPWYKKPGPIAALVIVVLAILALLGWLIFGGGDDEDEASATSTFLAFETVDSIGNPTDVGFAVAVEGPAGSESSFVWLRPDGVPPGDIAGESTLSDGRVEFEWEPDSTVADPAAWTSTVTVVAQVPPGWTPPGPNVDCVLRPFEGAESSVTFNIELDSDDSTIARVGTGTFPNQTFAVGDSVTCKLVATAPLPTTVVDTTVAETTVPDTTVVETTVPETTEAPATTTAPTTPPTVAPTTPPAVPATAYEALTNAGVFSQFLAVVDATPTVKALLEGTGPITVFAPNDDAFDGVTVPPADIEELLLSHIVEGEALDAAAVVALDGVGVEVATGGTQPIDASADPVTIGGAGIVSLDIESTNGFSHELDAIMPAVTS